MLNRLLLFFTAIIITTNCLAQETVEKKSKLTDHVSLVYHVLAGNPGTRHGSYQALFRKKTVIAIGMFENDKKAGVWCFFDQMGQAMQIYDYTKNQLLFEAREDTSSSLRYFVDKQLDSSSKATKPVKIGGRYYGYLPYLNLFTVPKDLRNVNIEELSAAVELLISPYGRLADYKVHLTAGNFERTINMNINLPDQEDRIFVAATLNGEPISSRVVIRCQVTNSGHLDFE